MAEINKLGASLVAITPQKAEHSKTIISQNNLEFDLLSDTSNAYTAALGLNFELSSKLKSIYQGFGIDLPACSGESNWVLPMPARLVVNSDGVVAATDVDPDYTVRPEASKTVSDIRALKA